MNLVNLQVYRVEKAAYHKSLAKSGKMNYKRELKLLQVKLQYRNTKYNTMLRYHMIYICIISLHAVHFYEYKR